MTKKFKTLAALALAALALAAVGRAVADDEEDANLAFMAASDEGGYVDSYYDTECADSDELNTRWANAVADYAAKKDAISPLDQAAIEAGLNTSHTKQASAAADLLDASGDVSSADDLYAQGLTNLGSENWGTAKLRFNSAYSSYVTAEGKVNTAYGKIGDAWAGQTNAEDVLSMYP
jgi:hypothetical protein